MEGSFEGKRKTTEDFQTHKFERSTIVKHVDNLKVTDGVFYSETTSKSDYQRAIEEDQPIRRNTYTKEEVENLNIDSSQITTIRRRTWTKEELEDLKKKTTETVKYKSIERPQQVKLFKHSF
jgi:hypothetical protein